MFNSYEFSFAGESSVMHRLMLYDFDGKGQSDVAFGNSAKIIETRIANKVQPIHFGVNYHNKPLEFKLVFGSQSYLDRYELEDISFWLRGHQHYQWLSIDQPDLEHVQFRCIITQLTPITHGWLPIAFEATVQCDCPYAYGFPFDLQQQIQGNTKILFLNDSLVREPVKPIITFIPSSGTKTLTITNHNDNNRTLKIDDIPSGSQIVINNQNGIIQEKKYGYNLYKGFNLNFFRFISGDNTLEITGDGMLTIEGRLFHNVAG